MSTHPSPVPMPPRNIFPHLNPPKPLRSTIALLASLPATLPPARHLRLFSTAPLRRTADDSTPKLTHLSATGAAHMVSIGDKAPTKRTAVARCAVHFSSPLAPRLVRENQMKKGDVLGVARVAGIMAAKKTSELIPLCHPINITHVGVELEVVRDEAVEIEATVSVEGRTGVEMEALTAAAAAALTVYDMCKAVDKGMVVGGLRVVFKEGGRSGRWVEGEGVKGV
ncbi:Molybdopterin cofactor biosynthesis C domain-containing protein [Schizothecium vesticola]|uniref:cyclic pyranopterin monophosphate synthase n=1 Tax=Schizothecium vesticola TaxID=314040 RepID=A0AA40BQK1_9PEZI|nr:Molybdopterin cofactor biosynthesis C domain-containing protein [Schizothecium vesticola]